MNGLEIFLIVILIYVLLMFVFSQILVPNLGWKRELNEDIPLDVVKDMKLIGSSVKNKEDVLKKVLNYFTVENGFYGEMNRAFSDLVGLFEKSFVKLWYGDKFLHCHQHNFVMSNLLLCTSRFSEDDLILKVINCYTNIHQYVKVNVSDDNKIKKWVVVDSFAYSLGFNYNEYLPRLTYFVAKKRGMKLRKNKHKFKRPK
ncbi:hypothetical protein K9L67_05160 [Candidatus Woesearchaeota archaeon]|nr:hypothetical protein [Candidatus Woesearchaeota archaeon]MCF7901587.1 hypothetical protein [Candidatus Woesearchaeota archaeon]MCF8013648.1 hypothetical protein [Candidatus Woesearchaeota archaeon]